MDDDQIAKQLLHEKLSQGTRLTGGPQVPFKDVCNRDFKAFQINTQIEEAIASDRKHRRQAVNQGFGPRQRLLVFLCALAAAGILLMHFLGVEFTSALYNKEKKQENNTERKEIMGDTERNGLRSNRQLIFPDHFSAVVMQFVGYRLQLPVTGSTVIQHTVRSEALKAFLTVFFPSCLSVSSLFFLLHPHLQLLHRHFLRHC